MRSRVPVLAETSLETVLATLEAERPDVCVIDSVQTLHSEELERRSGQRRAGAGGGRAPRAVRPRERLHGRARRPRDQGGRARGAARARARGRLRAPVRGRARAAVPHPARAQEPLRLDERGRPSSRCAKEGCARSAIRPLASPRDASAAPGSCVLCAMEGSRPLLVEVQALVAQTEVVPPRRVANGVDRNRLSLVLAVLGRHAGRELGGGRGLGSCDVFVNVAGGVRVEEPGADLAVALAVASAARGVALAGGEGPVACFGELGSDRRAALRRPRRTPARGGGALRPRAAGRCQRRAWRTRAFVRSREACARRPSRCPRRSRRPCGTACHAGPGRCLSMKCN